MELADIGLPLCLTGKQGQTGHVALEIEVVGGVHNHKELAPAAVDLHIGDSDFPLAFYDLGPYAGVSFDILGYHLLVVNEGEGLTITFHSLMVLLFLVGKDTKLLGKCKEK